MSTTFVLARLPHNKASLKIIELLHSLNIIYDVSDDVSFLHGILATSQSEIIFEPKIGEEELLILQQLIIKENQGVVKKTPKEEPIDEEEEAVDLVAQKPAENGTKAVDTFDQIEHDSPLNEEIVADAGKTDEGRNKENVMRKIDTDSYIMMAQKTNQDSVIAEDSDKKNSAAQITNCSEETDSLTDEDTSKSSSKTNYSENTVNKTAKQVLPPSFRKNNRRIPSKCPLCEEKFRSANQLRIHLDANHKGQRAYDCEQCDKKFRLREVYRRHVSSVHNKEKPFHCDQCKKSYKQKFSFERHMTKHI